MTRYVAGLLGLAVAVIMTLLLEIHVQACLYPYPC